MKRMSLRIIVLRFVLILATCTISQDIFAQNVLITDLSNELPDNNAVLDIKSHSRGVLLPRIELKSINDPINGMKPKGLLIWNTTATPDYRVGYYYWSGADWTVIGGDDYVPIELTNYISEALTASKADSILDKVVFENHLKVDELATQLNAMKEIAGSPADVIQEDEATREGAGLDIATGNYITPLVSHYITDATSIYDAVIMLDKETHKNFDALGNTVIQHTEDIKSNLDSISYHRALIDNNYSLISVNRTAIEELKLNPGGGGSTFDPTEIENDIKANEDSIVTNTTAIENLTTKFNTKVSGYDLRISGISDSVSTNTTAIANQTATITDLEVKASGYDLRITGISDSIATNTAAIANQTVTIADWETKISGYDSRFSGISDSVATNTTTIADQTATIVELNTRVSGYDLRFSGISDSIATNTIALENQTATLAELETKVSGYDSRFSGISDSVATNNDAIEKLTTDFDTRVSGNDSIILAIETKINNNIDSIAANTSAIANQTTKIAELDERIGFDMFRIESKVKNNENEISKIKAELKGDIATNKENILSLASRVSLLENGGATASVSQTSAGTMKSASINNTQTESIETTEKETIQGFLPPRMTLSEMKAIKNPEEGLMVYCYDLKRPLFFNGSEWMDYMGHALEYLESEAAK